MKLYCLLVSLLLVLGLKSYELLSAEQPLDGGPGMPLSWFEKLGIFDKAKKRYREHYGAKHEWPTELRSTLTKLFIDFDLLALSERELIKLLTNCKPSGYFRSQGKPDFITLNFLLDVMAPFAHNGQILTELMESMPIHVDGELKKNSYASDLGIAVPEIFAYVITRLVIGGADQGCIQRVRGCIQVYQNNLNKRSRLRFDEQMRETFNYFISKLRALKIREEYINNLNEEVRLLAPERYSFAVLSLSPNQRERLSRSSIDQAILNGLTGQLASLNSWYK